MTDVEVYHPAAIDEYRRGIVMTPEQARDLDNQLRACTRAVLREGTDYGVIPGTGDRKVLYKPGAEKLLQWFGLAFTCGRQEIEHDGDGRREGVTYRAVIFRRLPGGTMAEVATCEGYAGYDEDKFYQTAEQAQARAEARERYWAARDRRVANPEKWKHLGEYRAPWNTIIKMAQKRAVVGATIDATAAAGLFSAEEDDSGPVPDDDGPSYYQQALAQAAALTTEEAGRKLFAEAAHAARDGLCTPGQANHIQNRIRQRISLLKTATPVDVEDLARGPGAAGDAADATAAGAGASRPDDQAGSVAPLGPGEAAEYGTERHQKLIGIVWAHLRRLGYPSHDDEDDAQRAARLADVATLAGLGEIESTSDLDTGELSAVADTLTRCRSRARLETLLKAARGQVGGGPGA